MLHIVVLGDLKVKFSLEKLACIAFCAAVFFGLLPQVAIGRKKPQASVPVVAPSPQKLPDRLFAPYLATWFPENNFSQIAGESGSKYFILAFILGKPGACLPMWSNKKSIQEETSIAAEITALRKQGGDVIVSFGGAKGRELGRACKDPVSLQTAYRSVIDKYNLRRVDFDIETASVRDPDSVDRRNIAIAALERAKPALRVSFTLEVLPSGLTKESLDLLKNAARHGVRIDTVNILAMDYGPPADPNRMGQNAIDAANHTLVQLKELKLNAKLGITAMLGKNDVSPETFTQEDARMLLDFAQNNPQVDLLSMWSVGRDHVCTADRRASAGTCSGLEQQDYDFARILGAFR
jgi:hypothetical protein